MFQKIVMTLLLLAFLSGSAQAQLVRAPLPSRTGNWEFTMLTRYVGSQDVESQGGSSLSIADDMGWGFGVAYNYNQHFNLGMEFSWRSTNYTATVISEDDPGTVNHYSSKLDVSSWVLTGKYNVLKGRFTPYATGSFGWSLIDSNIFAGYGSGCYWDPWWGPVCGAYPTTFGDTTTTANLGVGFRAEITPKFFLRAAYEYNWLGIDTVDGENMGRFDIGFLF